MAKVYYCIVKYCFLFSFLINISNSYELKNVAQHDYNKYNIKTFLPELDGIQHYELLRTKRQTAQLTQPTVEISSNPVELSKQNNETEKNSPTRPSTNDENIGTTSLSSIIGNNANIETKNNNQTVTVENRPLLGVNGTGQLKNSTKLNPNKSRTIVSEPISSEDENKKLQILYPANGGGELGAAAVASTEPPTNKLKNDKSTEFSMNITIDQLIDDIDTPDNETIKLANQHNITTFKENYYQFYNSSTQVDKVKSDQYWVNMTNLSVNGLLSRSHRRAITVQLSFDFPFYGHPVRNITVATGGFLYTGEYVHSWLAATQYIAPLMANFDTNISNDSYVKLLDNGSSFTVLWENVYLQDRQDVGSFTFSVTLYDTGDIVFVYYSVPIEIESIQDDKHPVKIGLSDAYIIDKTIFFARRKTIYEYHRVNFGSEDISNNSIITLTANPTCLELRDCEKCVSNVDSSFKCSWCPTLNKCSTGTDRKRQEWLQKGCDQTQITEASVCPAIGSKGNNYGSQQEIEIKDVTNRGDQYTHDGGDGSSSKEETDALKNGNQPIANDSTSNVGVVLGLFIPIIFAMILILWIFYAYQNPHTKSGQLLIQYRPSQWSWRRGEARYTAATIHM